ncbi:MAG: MFS transporter [Micrococcales bacterium]
MTETPATLSKKRIAPFVLLQIASFTSLSGGSMVFILMPWMAIDLTGQASSAGLIVTLTSIPGLLVSPLIGSVIDKIGRRRSTIWTELLSSVVNFAIPVIAAIWTMNLPLLIVMSLIRSVVGSGGGTARKSLIPDVAAAGKISLERANSIHESVFAAGFAVGPALAALSIIWFGSINSFIVVGALGAVSAVLTMFIRVTEQHEAHDDDEGRHWASYAVQGFKILFKTPSVLILMSSIMTLAVVYLPTEMVVLPTYYNKSGHPEGLGFLISTMAAFTTLGSLLFERWVKYLSYSNMLRVALLGVGLSMLPMSLLPPQWVMLFFGAVLGFCWGPLPPLLNTVIQRKIPANKRGRVFSLEMTIWTAGPMISMMFVGWSVDTFTVPVVYPVIALAVLLTGLFVSTRKVLADLDRD